jgi:cytochrome c-type biogenesis protein
LSFSTDDIGVGLYDLQVSISHFIEVQLAAPTPASLSIIYASGLLTAFSPCSISLLPLTMAYLGYEQGKSSSALITRAALYAGGTDLWHP